MKKPVTVITGASKGIGLATARLLAAQEHHVIGLARTAPEQFPGDFVVVDLGDPSATQDAAADILQRFGGVHHLVNNVGLVKPAPIGEVRLDDFDTVMAINLKPALQLTQAFLPMMKAGRYGRIVNISSLVVLGMPLRTSYAAAKAALISFTRSWALELALEGITVNAVAPGPTETELFRENNPMGSAGEKRYLDKVPMRRFAKPAEIAEAIAFFMRSTSGIITGQTLFVDGGASIGQAAI